MISIESLNNPAKVVMDGNRVALWPNKGFPTHFLPNSTFVWKTNVVIQGADNYIGILVPNPKFYDYSTIVLNPIVDDFSSPLNVIFRKLGGRISIIMCKNPIIYISFMERKTL